MALDEPKEHDETIEVNGLSLLYDATDQDYLNNTVIDFQDSYFGKGFKIYSDRSAGGNCC